MLPFLESEEKNLVSVFIRVMSNQMACYADQSKYALLYDAIYGDQHDL